MDSETIPAGKFKAQCLKLLDEVGAGGRTLIVTKHGKPVAKIVPVKARKKKRLLGCMKGSVHIYGDIVTPMTEIWNLPE